MTEIETLFTKRERTEPIPFEEFQKAGWNERTFVDYLNKCETLRGGFVFFRGNGEWKKYYDSYFRYNENSPGYIAKEIVEEQAKTDQERKRLEISMPLPLSEAKELIEPLYDTVVEFYAWLNEYFDNKLSDIETALFILGIDCANEIDTWNLIGLRFYSTRKFDIFTESELFRYYIERAITRELLGDEPFEPVNSQFSSNEKIQSIVKYEDVEDIPFDEIPEIIENLEFERDEIIYPEISEMTLKSYASLQKWGKEFIAVEDVEYDYDSAITDLENELIERPSRKYVPEQTPVILVDEDFTCKYNHTTQKIWAVFQTKDKKGLKSELRSQVDYCPICDTYSIDKRSYRRLIVKEKALINPLINESDYRASEADKKVYDPETNILYIYGGGVECLENHSKLIEDVTAIIDDIYSKKLKLSVHYCPVCDYYFLKQSEYERYIQRYKFLPIKMKYKGKTKNEDFYSREEYSFLSLAGYTVRKDIGLSDDIRHRILVGLINAGYSKFEIENHLDMLINTNGSRPNMENARSKWLSDLKYVKNLHLDKQRKVRIARIVVGTPKRK